MPREPPPQEYARVVLVFILLFFLYSSPDQGLRPGFEPRDYAAERIARSQHSLDVLNSTKWRDFFPESANKPHGEVDRYLNLTGFRKDDDYAWGRLDAFKKMSEQFGAETKEYWRTGNDGKVGLAEIYENVTGVVVGTWVRHLADLNGEPKKRVMNLTQISPGIDWAYRQEELWTRNITGYEGKLRLNLDERHVDDYDGSQPDLGPMDFTRDIQATMTIQDETSSGDGWDMRLHGVHWPSQGVIYMTTTSDKFAGIFGLPHVTYDEGYYVTSQKHLNRTLEKVVERMRRNSWRDASNPWTSSPESQGDATMPTPHCELVVFAQIHQPQLDVESSGVPSSAHIMEQIEQELRYPNGAPIPKPPKLAMSTVMYSPDCGFILESKGPPNSSPKIAQHLIGLKQELYLDSLQKWLKLFAAVIFGQILLLKTQSKEASTPSTVGRVSLYTIAMMLMADALVFSSLSFLSALAPGVFPSAMITSFSALMSVALGVRFVGALYNVQEPERRERMLAQQAARNASARPTPPTPATPAPTPILTGAGAETLPITRTGAENNTPIIIPSDQDVGAEITEATNGASAVAGLPTTNTPAAPTQAQLATSNFGAVYIKFVLGLTFILFLSLSATSWAVPWRNAYVNFLSFIYLSFWVPQIRRNVIRNCRKALLWKFVAGQSLLRLLPFAYFYLKEETIIFSEPDQHAFLALAGWVWIQICVLVAQEILGPRWGLPKGWTEEAWDYHPVLREDHVEAGGLPIGLVKMPGSPTLDRARTSEDGGSGRKSKDRNLRSVDCSICMEVLEVPVMAAGEDISSAGSAGGVVALLNRRQYMVTPCRHIFHSHCLEGWMRSRLQCPICREALPPL